MTTRTGGPPESNKSKTPTTHAPGPGSGSVSPQLLASIVESSDDAIFSKTLDGIITSWNKAAERVYGYQAAQIVGQPVSVLMPRDRANEMTEIVERIRNGERVDQYETTQRTKGWRGHRDLAHRLTHSRSGRPHRRRISDRPRHHRTAAHSGSG